MSAAPAGTTPQGPRATDRDVDVLVIGSGTGMAAALAARELGLDVLVVEKSEHVGGSTARSGGAFWVPGNDTLTRGGLREPAHAPAEYLDAIVGQDAPARRRRAFLEGGPAAVAMLRRTTPLRFTWARGYADYHPEAPGGSAVGHTCESAPFDAAVLGPERSRLRPGPMAAPIPMPVTGADYKWMNLMVRSPLRAWPRILKRAVQGLGGLALRREYVAGGQALAAGLFAGCVRAEVPIWTRTALAQLVVDDDGAVRGAVLEQDGRTVTVHASRGVVLATGGFDHDMAMRREHQSPSLRPVSLGAESNTGDGHRAGQQAGGALALMEESWWFPAVAPVGDAAPPILLAERSLPGSLMVDQHGRRFVNEAVDYMSFGQRVLQRETQGDPVGTMWLVFDQRYRNSYLLAGSLFPGMPLPKAWYRAGVAVRADDAAALATAMGVPDSDFRETLQRFNDQAAQGVDHEHGRGASAYDRYYGDPTVTPNPNLRPLDGPLFAVQVVLSDLGTCGGLTCDEHARVLREDGSPVEGLYALGNTAANAFGRRYPGAGATIGQGIVFAHLAAQHIARQRPSGSERVSTGRATAAAAAGGS